MLGSHPRSNFTRKPLPKNSKKRKGYIEKAQNIDANPSRIDITKNFKDANNIYSATKTQFFCKEPSFHGKLAFKRKKIYE